jgi:molybdate transport system substrate-binding protein
MRRIFLLLFAVCCANLSAAAADAADVKVFCAVAMRSSLEELAPLVEKQTGHKLSPTYATAGVLRDKIKNGEAFDIAILPTPFMDPLVGESRVKPVTVWARSLIGVGARAGFPRPDISSVAAFKNALLTARAISYADPAQGGGSGIQVAKVIQALGIAEEMKPKTKLVPGPESVDLVAKGEAELALVNAPVIVNKAGLALIGTIPSELYDVQDFAFKIGTATNPSSAVNAVVQYLTGPDAARVLKAKGTEPGPG